MKVPSAEYDNSICHFMIFLKQKACCNIKNINTPDVLFLFMTGFFDMITIKGLIRLWFYFYIRYIGVYSTIFDGLICLPVIYYL